MTRIKNLLKKYISVLILLPLVIGAVGYQLSGEKLTDSLYASFALYFTNPISDAYNLYIEIARWIAPIATATTILCILRSMWLSLSYRLQLFGKRDSVAVYSDETRKIFHKKNVSVIYPGDKFKGYADSHIILFSSDQKSLQFYEEHKKELDGKRKKVYIGIKEIENGLIRKIENVTVFDINNAVARLLWKKIALWKLWEKKEEVCDIIIYGSGRLAEEILTVGLQLNLFSLSQRIRYTVISDNTLFRVRHSGLDLMNGDEIRYYTSEDAEIWELIPDADMVIIADVPEADLLQTIVTKAKGVPVYYYSPDEGDLPTYISFGKLIPFGRDDQVFTDDNIRRRELVKRAIALNEYYAEKYGSEKEWEALSGFLKASNISSSDFGEVLAALKNELDDIEMSELEHIRWCRFNFLNYYTYGIPENGKNRDDEKRIHKDLVRFGALNPDEQKKDLDTINITRNI